MSDKPKLKSEPAILVYSNDFYRFTKKALGHHYLAAEREDYTYGNHKQYRVEAKYSFEDGAEEYAKFKKTGEGDYIMRALLEGLCIEGWIPPGIYIVAAE